jgi:hypothetical protein
MAIGHSPFPVMLNQSGGNPPSTFLHSTFRRQFVVAFTDSCSEMPRAGPILASARVGLLAE